MKKMITRRIALVFAGLALLSQSCTDLEEELFSQVTAESFFQTDEEFIAALGQAYSAFGGLGNHSNLWSTNELASDELVITTKGGDWFDGGVLIDLHRHEYDADNGFFNNTWTFCYGGISTVNRLIFQFSSLGNPEAEAFVSELRAVRALWYYWLLDSFGNVPLVTDFTDTAPKGNSSRAEVFNFVESELNAVIGDLSKDNNASTYGRMNYWAALALRSKLYLNAEVYTGTAKWSQAAADAREIMNDGGFSLAGIYADNFSADNEGSPENIFVVPYDQVFSPGFNWPAMTLHYASQGVFNLTFQPWNGYSVVEEFYNSYIDPDQNPGPQGFVFKGLNDDPNATGTQDERLSNFIAGPQFNTDGTQAEDPGVEDSDPDGPGLNFTPFINEIFPNGWRQGGVRIGKYEYEQGSTENLSNDFVVFRLANIMLTLAEAEYRQGNTAEALALVNQLRARAGVDPFTELNDDNFLAEWGREMFAELTRRQDLIRWGKYGEAWWEKDPSAEFYEIFPIPQAQLDASSALQQNPGYN